MQERNIHIARLISKYLNGQLSITERQDLDKWLNESEENRLFFKGYANKEYLSAELREYEDIKVPVLPGFEEEEHPVRSLSTRRKLMIAAGIIVFLAAGFYSWLYFRKAGDNPVAKKETPHITNDVAPGGDKAILTLADGSRIVLDNAANGTITQQGSTKVIKLNGQLKYSGQPAVGSEQPMAYNTITTPKGGQYQLILPDGSKVWLNAASSLRFPTAFTGKERKVELNGEGYFEIAQHTAMPFIVDAAGNMTVKVLGTHFNIMAYADEDAVATTLLEGRVIVSATGSSSIAPLQLKPGQQVLYAQDSKWQLSDSIDTDAAVAWKNGVFQWNNTSINAVLRQVSRWYDVEILWKDRIGAGLTGAIPRDVPLIKLCRILEETGKVHFSIEGKKLVVSK